MISMFWLNRSSNQLRWVILLLSIAVILPTVCLLWFTAQTVKNERLAVRQKLIDIYSKKAQHFFIDLPDSYSSGIYIDPVKDWTKSCNYEDEAYEMFELFAVGPDSFYEGMLIYDSNGSVVYPIIESVRQKSDELIEPFRQELEGNLKEAIEQYEKVAEETQSDAVRYRALLSKARCLDKLDMKEEAVELASKLSYPANPESIDSRTATVVIHSRVFLAELYNRMNDRNLYYHIRRILGNNQYDNEKYNPYLPFSPAGTIIWQLNKLIDMAYQADLSEELTKEIEYARRRINAYRNSIKVAETYPDAKELNIWPDYTVKRITPQPNLYGLKFGFSDKTVLGISSSGRMLEILMDGAKDIQDDTIGVQVYNNSGQFVGGDEELAGKPFLTMGPGGVFKDFEVAIYFKSNSVFEDAASRQTTIYVWTGALVVVLIFISGAMATQAIGRQMKLNRLKNDFIATVTHELKTPLSSMRVLVDTLLEGNYENEKTAKEYLRLISRENERLSRLIDNFLTFSRMERNKQAFEIGKVSPVEIANSAVEVLRTKFEKKGVDFKMDIVRPLAMVNADKDAMVTVLVNLLGNAFKYTNSDKRIELRIFQENDFVCFSVKDNGIGMNRKQIKKAFERFYQVDSSLSRRADGAGLGLSIVKFIVDAHKGTISIISKPGKGSTFTVKLRSCAGNGNNINNRR